MAISADQVKALWNSRLAKLEPEIIRPLANYYFTRDIPIVEDLDKVSNVVALRNIKGIGQGTKDANGMSWLGKGANDLRGVDYELNATAVAVYTAGREISVTSMELEAAQKAEDINVNAEQVELVNDKFLQEAHQVGYLGDSGLGFKGFLNNAGIKKGTTSGALSATAPTWDDTAKAIDDYFNQAYQATKGVIMPNTMLLTPAQYVKLFSMKAPDDRHFSMIDYIEKESLGRKVAGSMTVNQVNELSSLGTSSKDRMVLYTKDKNYVRYHIRPVWREKSYDKGLDYCAAYLWRLAEVQFRRPETVMYFDNI